VLVVAVGGQPGPEVGEPLERARWADSLRHTGDTELANLAADAENNPTDADIVRAIAATTLVAPSTEQHTIAVLRGAVPGLSDAPTSLLGRIYRWLRGLYPADHDGGIVRLRPDLLAEQLLAETDDLTGLTVAALAVLLPAPPATAAQADGTPDTTTRLPDAQQTSIAGLLNELTRASGRAPVRTAAEAALDHALLQLTAVAVAHRHDDPASPYPPRSPKPSPPYPAPTWPPPPLPCCLGQAESSPNWQPRSPARLPISTGGWPRPPPTPTCPTWPRR
jgi:hypothetical protein